MQVQRRVLALHVGLRGLPSKHITLNYITNIGLLVAIFKGLVDDGPALRQHWFNVWWLLGRVIRICHSIQLPGEGGGAGVFELDKLFISPPICNILFISHSASRKICICFSSIFFPIHNIDPKLVWLSINVGVKETSEKRIYIYYVWLKKNWGPLNIYLQHVLKTIIYFIKIQSQKFTSKILQPSPPPLAIEWWPPYDQSQNVQLSLYSCSQRHHVAYIVDEFASKKARPLAYLFNP